jgi:hypothetical protein
LYDRPGRAHREHQRGAGLPEVVEPVHGNLGPRDQRSVAAAPHAGMEVPDPLIGKGVVALMVKKRGGRVRIGRIPRKPNPANKHGYRDSLDQLYDR